MKKSLALNHKALIVTLIFLIILCFLDFSPVSSQSPATDWERTFGIGEGYSVVQTSDGGYAIGGGDSENYYGNIFHEDYIFLLIKTDENGVEKWSKTYGERGQARSYARSVVQTVDGGYALAGEYVVPTVDENNENHWWTSFRLVKTDNQGNMEWDKTYLGPIDGGGYAVVIQTEDKGFALAGSVSSGEYGIASAWLVKTDSDGNLQWSKSYGEYHYGENSTENVFFSVAQTHDNGYVMSGFSEGSGALLVRTDSLGNLQWSKTYKEQNIDYFRCVIEAEKGGFLLAAEDATASKALLVKTDSNGTVEWKKSYSEDVRDEVFWSVKSTLDGGYIAVGRLQLPTYNSVVWIVKTDSVGNEEWSTQQYGGPDDYSSKDITVAKNGGYVFVGNNKDRVWLVKIPSTTPMPQIEETPEIQWERNFGFLEGNCLIQTFDGGYAIAGSKADFYQQGRSAYWINHTFHLIKTTAIGDLQWKRTYGDPDNERCEAYSVFQTSDGGYAVFGTRTSESSIEGSIRNVMFFWLVKTDSNGIMLWNKNVAGPFSSGSCVGIQTSDGGYAVIGSAISLEEDKSAAWLTKIDEEGNEQWNKVFEDDRNVNFNSITEADAGSIVAVGVRYVDDRQSVWLVKIGLNGREIWNTTFRAEGSQTGCSVAKTNDGGYIIAGGNTPLSSSDMLGLLVKTDSNGNKEWIKTYWLDSGESSRFISVDQTLDSGYVVIATIDDGVWIMKTDSFGDKLWDLVNGNDDDLSKDIIGTVDGGFAFTGERNSHNRYGNAIMLVKGAQQTTSVTPDPKLFEFHLALVLVLVLIVVIVGIGLFILFKKYKR
jgi:hypothetical protein